MIWPFPFQDLERALFAWSHRETVSTDEKLLPLPIFISDCLKNKQ